MSSIIKSKIAYRDFRIMAASGHRTISVFKRYNIVAEDELRGLVVPPIGTYIATTKKKG